MKFIPDNMHDVWTILSGIDGSVIVELGRGVMLPGMPMVADIRAMTTWPKGLGLVVERQPVPVVRIERL